MMVNGNQIIRTFSLLGLSIFYIGLFSLANRVLVIGAHSFILVFLGLLVSFALVEKPGISLKLDLGYGCLSIVSVIVAYLPSIYASYLMSQGGWPQVFFNVDSPFHYSQAIQLFQSNQYPPQSLNNLGVVYNYHFGSQLAAAELGRLGIPLNKVYFGIIFYLFLISIAALMYCIGAGKSTFVKITVLSLPFCSGYIFSFTHFDVEYFVDIQGFSGGYPHISIVAVTYAAILLVYLTQNDGYLKNRFIISALPSLVLLFKSPSVFAFLFFYMGWVSIKISRRNFFRSDIIFSILSFLLFIFVLNCVSNENAIFRFVGFFANIFNSEFQFLLFLFLLAFVYFLSTQDILIRWKIYIYASVGLILLVLDFLVYPGIYIKVSLFLIFFAVLSLLVKSFDANLILEASPYIVTIGGILSFYYSFELLVNNELDRNFRQILFPIPYFYCSVLIIFLGRTSAPYIRKMVSILPTVVLVLIFVFNRMFNLFIIVNDEGKWHEYVDNSLLAECLEIIPVEGSLIVTNDLRYAASDHMRAGMALQIPALFGHQMYAGNSQYERHYVDFDRFELQEILGNGNFTDIRERADELHWTHAVIYKRPDSSYIDGDWQILCENDLLFIAEF